MLVCLPLSLIVCGFLSVLMSVLTTLANKESSFAVNEIIRWRSFVIIDCHLVVLSSNVT